jgi:hypothetical protein
MALIKIIMKRTEVQTKLNLRWEDYRLPQQVLLIFQLANKQWGFKEHNNTHQSTVELPIAFKNGGYVGAANDSGTVTIGIKPASTHTIELRDNNVGEKTGIYWFVVGL